MSQRIAHVIVAIALSAAPQLHAQKSISNDNYGFTLQIPAEWSAQRVKMSDPLPDINEFKAGRVELKGGIDTGGEEPADWNALQLNGMQALRPDGVLESPQITFYAHPHAAKTFDEFSAEFGEWLALFRTKPASANKLPIVPGLEAYQYVYQMGPMQVRLTAVFGNGVRYAFMAMALDSASFAADGPAYQALVQSLRLTTPVAPAPVN